MQLADQAVLESPDGYRVRIMFNPTGQETQGHELLIMANRHNSRGPSRGSPPQDDAGWSNEGNLKAFRVLPDGCRTSDDQVGGSRDLFKRFVGVFLAKLKITFDVQIGDKEFAHNCSHK